MKILLIGHSIIDHIKEAGSKNIQPGGIFYSTLGINSVSCDEDEIYLLTGINRNFYYLFEKQYSKVNPEYIFELDRMPEVELTIPHSGERLETYRNISTHLPVHLVKEWNYFDGILINMITGFDINMEQLHFIRSNFKGIIYLDVHTLARGLDSNMKRDFRPIPDVEILLNNVDLMQCNESELKTICNFDDEMKAAKWILSREIKSLILTKAEKGATSFEKVANKINTNYVQTEKIIAFNKIGCGDIFGAFFFYSYIRKQNMATSLKLASRAGAVAASSKDLFLKSKIEVE